MIQRFLLGDPMQHMGGVSAWPVLYIADTMGEMPSSGLVVGSLCYCKDSSSYHRATSATVWTELGGGSGGPHTHAIGDVTNLQAALDGKAAIDHTHPSGSDPWTYLRLTTDFTTSSATAVDVTGLGFTPAANTRYEFVGRLMVRTATATVGPRPGIAWPTGMADGVAFVQQTSAAATNVFANGNITAAVLAPVGGVPTTTGSWPALIEGMAIAGASPSGSIRIQLASETAGTVVRIVAGSFLKYRTVP